MAVALHRTTEDLLRLRVDVLAVPDSLPLRVQDLEGLGVCDPGKRKAGDLVIDSEDLEGLLPPLADRGHPVDDDLLEGP